ncbi:hypothetical protein VD0004_g8471 [Verticillium dahliae]|nr:hypothetical protein VD0004_g8471 [Verticillium dahliae]PNH77557.1 hypothetical protein VD0001_g83 [Verticillium dahliae]
MPEKVEQEFAAWELAFFRILKVISSLLLRFMESATVIAIILILIKVGGVVKEKMYGPTGEQKVKKQQ